MSWLDDIPEILADALGDDFRPAVLTRMVASQSSTSFDPEPAVPTTYDCRAIHDEWSAAYRANGLITAKDWKILVLAKTLAVEPREGDRITLEGVTLTVVSEGGMAAVTSDPATATWTLKCRL